MNRMLSTSLIALAATTLVVSPALAGGKNERATAAIAAAQARIDAANKVGASGQVPALQARATAMLATAREDLSRGLKDDAIADATRASELADQALGEAERAKSVNAALRVDAAAAAAQDAQAAAVDANARANAAENAAAAARATPAPAPVIVQVPAAAPAPAPATTTVTTETTATPATTVRRVAKAPKRVVKRRVVRGSTAAAVHVTTKSTVTSR